MVDLITGLSNNILVILVLLLSGYFIWSVKSGIKEIKELIKELFEDRNNHESRILRLEVRCGLNHMHQRASDNEDELFQRGVKDMPQI